MTYVAHELLNQKASRRDDRLGNAWSWPFDFDVEATIVAVWVGGEECPRLCYAVKDDRGRVAIVAADMVRLGDYVKMQHHEIKCPSCRALVSTTFEKDPLVGLKCPTCAGSFDWKPLGVPDADVKAKIRAEYISQRQVYGTLVGTLYPAMAYDRLMEMRARYVEGTDSYWGDLPPVPQPNPDGSAPFFS